MYTMGCPKNTTCSVGPAMLEKDIVVFLIMP